MNTLEAIQMELGDKFQTLWAHTITRGRRGARVSPANPGNRILWGPTLKETEEEDVKMFDMGNLGTYLPSWEVNGEAGLECQGMLRPAFELALEGNQLEPAGKANPKTANVACLFLKKHLKLKKSHVITL